jgi:hypothetical protein
MDTIYVATWTSEYGDERKAFARKIDAEVQLRNWLGHYIVEILEDDGIEETKEYLDTIVVHDDEEGTWYQVGKDKEQIYVDEIEFKA